jgi:integrase
MRACWNWAIKRNLATANPWEGVKTKVAPKQKPHPFTLSEIEKILNGFKSDRYYSHYADFVEFLFGTGCRIGEVIALQWSAVNQDCSVVWIGASWARGERKATKTNKARYISLPPKLQAMLIARQAGQADPAALVFPSPEGHPIDDHNFRNRAWKSVLRAADIPYRKPYLMRSTLISHALDSGMSAASVAELTGHRIETMFRDYAGNVQNRPKLPELW